MPDQDETTMMLRARTMMKRHSVVTTEKELHDYGTWWHEQSDARLSTGRKLLETCQLRLLSAHAHTLCIASGTIACTHSRD